MSAESIWIDINYSCHMCGAKFNDIYQVRDHWARDHNYYVTIRIKP
jgi:hypothetical protein